MILYQNKTKSVTLTSEQKNIGLGFTVFFENGFLAEVIFINLHLYLIKTYWHIMSSVL